MPFIVLNIFKADISTLLPFTSCYNRNNFIGNKNNDISKRYLYVYRFVHTELNHHAVHTQFLLISFRLSKEILL